MVVLQIDASITDNCKIIRFYEKTGQYNSITNPTGWGSPNEDTSDANTVNLTIETPDGNSYTINITAGFPNTDLSGNTYYSIDSSMIGYGTNQKLPDGIYRFTYKVITDSNTYTQVTHKLFYCNAKCCVFNMFLNIDFDCDCSKEKQERAINAYLMLKGLQSASDCGSINYFNELLNSLEKICKKECSNC